MSYNGSGVFVINTAGQPVVTGTVISSSTFNLLTADLATGLSTCITKDGQTTVTANIPMNNFKFTGLAAGSAATDSARLGQVQAGGATVISVSGTDTYTGSLLPALTAYTAGNTFTFVVPNTNTGAATLNIDALGAKAITRDGSTALVAGDLVANSEVIVIYDGTRFQLVNGNSKTNFTISGSLTFSGSPAAINAASGLTVNNSGSTPVFAVTFSATAMTLDCTKSNVFSTTFTANVTTAPTISNPQDGQTINWFITQDATGSRTMTWPTSFKWVTGSAGVLSTTANAVDMLVATYRSATGFWYASLMKGFA